MRASPFKYTTSALQLEIINKKLFNNFNEDGLKLRHAAKEQKKTLIVIQKLTAIRMKIIPVVNKREETKKMVAIAS